MPCDPYLRHLNPFTFLKNHKNNKMVLELTIETVKILNQSAEKPYFKPKINNPNFLSKLRSFSGAGDRTHIASQSALLVRQAHSHHFAKNSHLDCFLYAKCLLKLQVLSSVIEKNRRCFCIPCFFGAGDRT